VCAVGGARAGPGWPARRRICVFAKRGFASRCFAPSRLTPHDSTAATKGGGLPRRDLCQLKVKLVSAASSLLLVPPKTAPAAAMIATRAQTASAKAAGLRSAPLRVRGEPRRAARSSRGGELSARVSRRATEPCIARGTARADGPCGADRPTPCSGAPEASSGQDQALGLGDPRLGRGVATPRGGRRRAAGKRRDRARVQPSPPTPANRLRELGFLDAIPYYFRHTSRFVHQRVRAACACAAAPTPLHAASCPTLHWGVPDD
jgi:hypothetical protein